MIVVQSVGSLLYALPVFLCSLGSGSMLKYVVKKGFCIANAAFRQKRFVARNLVVLLGPTALAPAVGVAVLQF